jgi:hypothetical protein
LQDALDHLKDHILNYRKWEVEHSDEHCKLRDQFIRDVPMILVGKDGHIDTKAAATRRHAEKKKSPG